MVENTSALIKDQNNMQDLTIIIPVYNEAPFLRRCLSSVAKQSRKCEVIIVDDGSTDESGQICEEYKSYGFQIYHIENHGVSYARNYGLDRTKTKWVTFLDADDELPTNAVKYMLNEAHSKEKMLGFNQLRYYDRTKTIKRKYYNAPGYYTLQKLPIQFCMVWNKMYQTEFLNENKIRFWENLHYGEDEIFNLECILKCKKIKWCNPYVIVRHFDNKNSICHLIMDKDLDAQMKALKVLLDKTADPEGKEVLEWIIQEHSTSGWDRLVRNKQKPTD